jgi:hypothetical protein
MSREGQKTKIEDLLRDAKSTNFNNTKECEDFEKRHEKRLSRRTPIRTPREGILHEIAKDPRSFAQYKDFITWIIKTYPQHLDIKAQGGLTPLHLAFHKKNHAFIELVVNNASSVKELLCQQTDLSMTCLHLAIEQKSPLAEWIIKRAKEASADSVSGNSSRKDGSNPFIIKSTDKDRNFDGTTPLHIAVTPLEYESDEEEEDSEDIYESEIDEEEDGVVEDGAQERANTDFDRHYFDYSSEKPSLYAQSEYNGPLIPQATGRDATKQFSFGPPQRVNSIRPSRQATVEVGAPIPKPDIPGRRRQFNIVDVVKNLIGAYDRVLVDCKDAEGRTPFQARLFKMMQYSQSSHKADDAGSDTDPEEIRRAVLKDDELLNYMREYIIDNFSRQEAMKALYEVGHGKPKSTLFLPSIVAHYCGC